MLPGTQSATVVSLVGGQSASSVASATSAYSTATSSATGNTIVKRDVNGSASFNIVTASLNGNATSATTSTNFSGSLAGDVTGTQSVTVVSSVGGQTAVSVASGTIAANNATNADTASTIVKRDTLGGFAAGTITANLTGNASGNVLKTGDIMTGTLQLPSGTSTVPSLTFTGSTTTGVSAVSDTLSLITAGNQVVSINGDGVVQIATLTSPVGSTTGVVHNDASGNLSTALIVNADIATGAGITDSKLNTISTSGKVANSATTATNLNTASTIVARDSGGNFNAGTITASLSGNATSATTAGSFTGSLSGDVTGTQSATVVSYVGGSTAASVAAAAVAVASATNFDDDSTLVARDSAGNFSANTIFANLTGSASNNVLKAGDTMTGNLILPAGSATVPSLAFTGSTTTGLSATTNVLSLIAGGNQGMTVSPAGTVQINQFTSAGVVHNDTSGNLTTSLIVNADIGASAAIIDSKLATISTSGKVANSATTATSSNTGNTIVQRDTNGNFSAGTITANLTGNATTATSATSATTATTATNATNFTGSLIGDVTGTQTATVVSLVGGVTAANVASGATAANAATNTNTASTIVERDSLGNFATNMVTLDGTPTNPTDATTKAYVDAAASTGIVPIGPAVVVATSQTTLSGLQTIDSITLVDSNEVLVVNQTVSSQNGVWLAHSGSWTRPFYFDTGNAAGRTYVLILEGTYNGGSSWLCNTPTAIIDTDPITFIEFSLPGGTTGSNVGSGTGLVYQGTTGNVLNFKSILAGTHMTVTNNANDVAISTDATSANTASTIVARRWNRNIRRQSYWLSFQ